VAEESTQHYLRSLNINEKLISSIDNGIIILDSELTIHYFNNWLEIHTSLKEETLLNKRIDHIFQNINTKTLKRKIKTALSMGTPTFYSASTSKYLIPIKINQLNVSGFRHMRQDVSVIPFDVENKLVALIITDQTNMTNTNNLLESNIKKVKELYSELKKERDTIDKKVLLLKFDHSYKITNASHAYLKLTQYNNEDILQKSYFDYQNPFLDDLLQEEILKHIKEKKVFNFENKTYTKTGYELILSHTLVPEFDPYAKHIGFILFMENITDTKKLIVQQEKLLSSSRSAAMGEMISMIAHQWRQPLSLINTVMATLRIKQELNLLTEEITNESFKKIEQTVQFLSETIDNFRDYFKPNKTIKNISISDIIKKSTTFLIQEMKVLSIEYNFDIEENITVQAFQGELMQCIINILKNSIDAFKENKCENQKIDVIAKKHSDYVSIIFKDNAGGIAKDIIDKVFDPYFSTKSKNGTGIGLYMTKTIIEEHLNGKIKIQSSHKETVILIELPYTLK